MTNREIERELKKAIEQLRDLGGVMGEMMRERENDTARDIEFDGACFDVLAAISKLKAAKNKIHALV